MRSIRGILVVWLSGLALLAAGGVTLFHHFCACNREVSTSLFFDRSCCTHRSAPVACCAGHRDAGCTARPGGRCGCETTVEVHSIDGMLPAPATPQLPPPQLPLHQEALPPVMPDPLIAQGVPMPLRGYQPPRAWGKELIIILNHQKIPPQRS